MASVNPRVSGLWTPSDRMSYSEGMEDDQDYDGYAYEAEDHDGRTPLDKTIDRIGMGSYQWTLLSLCGFGWLADNMWIQAVAIILPRVQQHFAVSDKFVGTVSSSMFAGMMFGAVGWGTCSDLLGRTTAFNATLFLTAVFGVLASFANSFVVLCICLFFLGTAVGGSMPTDGTLLLEHMPNGKQYLVTALSVFFSFGAVLSAIIGLLLIPGHSCPPAPAPCDVQSQNMGWKYLLISLGLITLSMCLARIVFFRLHESPRYLVHAGRPEEALESLQLISKFNGSELSLGLADVADHHPANSTPNGNGAPSSDEVPNTNDHAREPLLAGHDANVEAGQERKQDNGAINRPAYPSVSHSSRDVLRNSAETDQKDYSSTGSSQVALDSHSVSPSSASGSRRTSFYAEQPSSAEQGRSPIDNDRPAEARRYSTASVRRRPPLRNRDSRRLSTTSSFYEARSRLYWMLPRWLRKPLWAWMDRVAMVLSPEWFKTTVIVWIVWCSMSLAYTMFNVYLPKLLETRTGMETGADNGNPKSLTDSLWDVVIYSIGGCPGAIVGAYMVDSRIGKRWSLAGSTFVTAFFCVCFLISNSLWTVRASTVGISLSATTMWAVLYGWTPEIFGTKVRGTACGIASALSRIGGMIAPILGGSLLMIDHAFPVYASIVVFLIAGAAVLFLSEDEGRGNGDSKTVMH
ncbi:MFS general substrate transporter [Panus rudis PR-1116 ss-1]|nr:MFS general substrate transporter [Panus rudis PR-1116 ss-1]